MSITDIKINEIELKNFMVFKGEHKYKFDDIITIISGNNASGKSTLTSEAIYFNLFGKSLRSNKISDLITFGEKEGYVKIKYELTFDDDNKIFYAIHRFIGKNNFVDVEYEIINKNKDKIVKFLNAQNLINFKSINDFNVAIKENFIDIDKFLKSSLKSPFSKTLIEDDKIITEIVNSEQILDFYQKIKDVVKNIEYNFKIKKTELDKIKKIIEENKEKNKEEIMSLIKLEKENFNLFKNEYLKYKKLREKLQNKLKIIDDNINKFYEKKEKLLKWITKIKTMNENLEKNINKEKKLLEKNVCPVCLQNINEVVLKNKIKKHQDKLDENLDKLKAYNNKLKIVNKKILELENNKNELNDKIYKIVQKISHFKAEMNNTNRKISELKKSLDTNDNDVIINMKKTLEEELKELKKDYTYLKANLNYFDKKSEYYKKYVNEKLKVFNRLFSSILANISKNKLYGQIIDGKIKLNKNRTYKMLSTSERKIVDIAYTIAYIILGMKKNKMPLILDEFFDNFDKEKTQLVFNKIYSIAKENNKQIIITTNYIEILSENLSIDNLIIEL